MRVYSDGGRSLPSVCTSMLRDQIWAMTGPRLFSNSSASTSRTPPPDRQSGRQHAHPHKQVLVLSRTVSNKPAPKKWGRLTNEIKLLKQICQPFLKFYTVRFKKDQLEPTFVWHFHIFVTKTQNLEGAFKLTGLTNVIDLFQKRQTLLLRPVMNDSGQNIQVRSRKFTTEEISCVQKVKRVKVWTL